MPAKKFVWLHIKKSGGTTIRALLGENYTQVDRTDRPPCFIQSSPEEYNDILNNYRTVLGEYQFKRALFAKKFLYPDTWQQLVSFAFCRDPLERCLSMFFYLYWQDKNFLQKLKHIVSKQRRYTISYLFDQFLDDIAAAQNCGNNYHPHGLHFSTHTATMWSDITDETDNVLLQHVFRLENLNQGLNQIYQECDIPHRIEDTKVVFNKTENRYPFQPSSSQIKKIESLYSNDFQLYESS